jgi:uncharacterized protein
MNNNVIEVQVRAVLPVEGSYAIFLGDASKTFVIYVEETVGSAISMFMRGIAKERPLTHDLLASVLMAFGAKVDRVVINHINGPIFHARLIIVAENELHSRKVIELDARPSDSIAMAMHQKAPIFVAQHVWESVEDVTERLMHFSKLGEGGDTSGLRNMGGLASFTEASDDEDDLEEIEDDEVDKDIDLDEDEKLDAHIAAMLGIDTTDDQDDENEEDDDDDFFNVDDLLFEEDEDDDENDEDEDDDDDDFSSDRNK